MNKKNNQAKRFSIQIIVGIFTLIISTAIMYVTLKEKLGFSEVNFDKSTIESINPLSLKDSALEIDKTSSNIDIINNIKKIYNIDIIYGSNSKNVVKTVNASPLDDSDQINNFLWELMKCLEKYPKDLLKEIQFYGYELEIYLVDSFSNNNIALATRDSNNNFRIFLSNVKTKEKIGKSVHHELYHILEYYMKLEYDIDQLYGDWTSYNPDGFKYNSDITKLTKEYVYELADDNSGKYFVTIYSKTSEKEDRAEIFTDMMLRNSMPDYYTDSVGAIKNKVISISTALKKSFVSVKYANSLYWERYIH